MMNAAHLHLILNHIPVLGGYAVLILLMLAYFQKSSPLAKLSLQLMVLVGLLTLATYFTGEPAEESIESMAGVEESYIERHEDFAFYSLITTELLAAIGVALLFKMKSSPGLFTKYWKPIFAIALINGVLMAVTANFGGEIRHSEIRTTDK